MLSGPLRPTIMPDVHLFVQDVPRHRAGHKIWHFDFPVVSIL